MVLSSREMRHDVHLEQLALLGLTTLLEVHSVVLWFFFITFENKEMIPPEKDLRNNRGCDESTEASLQFFHLPAED